VGDIRITALVVFKHGVESGEAHARHRVYPMSIFETK